MFQQMLEKGKIMRSFHKRYDYLIHQMQKNIMLDDKVVVDCGCGDGDGVIHFARIGCQVIGIDISKRRIKTARAAFPELDFRTRSLLDTGLPDDFVDIFICSETLEHLSRKQSKKAAAEMKRVCKDKSYICITVPENKKTCLAKKGHVQYLSEKDILSHFSNYSVVHNSIFYKNPKRRDRGNRVIIFRVQI